MSGRPAMRPEGGQTLAEFAIVIPLILLLLLGTVDLGRAVFSYNTLAQAARAGSRTAIVNQDPAIVRSRVIDAAVTVGLTSSDVQLCFKTATSTQADCAAPAVDDCPHTSRHIGCLALVTASTTYRPMTPFVSLIWSTIPISSTSVAPIEYVCPRSGVMTCP